VRLQAESDVALLRRWRGGDADARTALFERHYARVRRFFDAKVPAVAEELTQRTLEACVVQMQRVSEVDTFRSYLFGIARNQLLMWLRSSKREQIAEAFHDSSISGASPSPSLVFSALEEQRLLLQGLDRLPVDLQIAVQLFYWEEMTSREIGVVLGIPTSTVTSRLARARELLREHLSRLARTESIGRRVYGDLARWTRSLATDDQPR
jgi:RNA polymerase sigma-70 factor (ECF subfamily)